MQQLCKFYCYRNSHLFAALYGMQYLCANALGKGLTRVDDILCKLGCPVDYREDCDGRIKGPDGELLVFFTIFENGAGGDGGKGEEGGH